MAADVFLSFHLICDCCRARVVSCFIITRVTVLVGVYCYLYGSIRFLCCISISSYRTGGCLLLLVWQHSILVLYMHYDCHMMAMPGYMYHNKNCLINICNTKTV